MNNPSALSKVLITGAGGFLGAHVLACAPAATQCIAGLRPGPTNPGPTNHGTTSPNPGTTPAPPGSRNPLPTPLDLSRPQELGPLLQTLQPDGILHLAAMADTGACEREPALSQVVNVQASAALAQAAAELGVPMVFCSTDLVFDGEHAPYRPQDPPNPQMVYGRHKAEAEQAVLRNHPAAVIARLPLMYGLSDRPGRGMIGGMREAFRSGQLLRLFSDEYRSLAHAACVARGLWKALHWPGGIYHFGGPQRLSRLEFGLSLARALGADTALIASLRQRDLDTGTPRPADVSLDSSSSYALGFAHGSLEEELQTMDLTGMTP